MIVRKITIVLRGDNESDVESAFEEAVKRVSAGCVSGTDRNECSAFYFETIDNVPPEEIPA